MKSHIDPEVEEKVKTYHRFLLEFTMLFGSPVGKLAFDKLIEWRALMGFQLGDEWWEKE